ncbi:holin [Luteimonas sp. XNQY3]|nr:holin [Luteimonas sp. XNQY3]MCD9005212.1 holin [Luteimonas sp. XNQY3]
MSSNAWSILALPALSVVWLTAMFGLNDVRPYSLRRVVSWAGAVDFGLGLSFLAMALGSFMMLAAVIFGAHIYTWRGCLLMWGVAGVFGLVGKFAPWRRWIRRLSQMESAR